MLVYRGHDFRRFCLSLWTAGCSAFGRALLIWWRTSRWWQLSAGHSLPTS
jgi:hypothetical protein